MLFFALNTVYGQEKKALVDSSYSYLKSQIRVFQKTDSAKAMLYIDTYLKKAMVLNSKKNIADAYRYRSQVLKNDSIYLDFLDSLIHSSRVNPDKNYPLKAYERKGSFYLGASEYELSLQYYFLALEAATKFKDAESEVRINYVIDALYKKKKSDQEKQIKNNLEKLHQYRNDTAFKNSYSYTLLLFRVANDYKNQKRYDSALYYSRLAYKHSIQLRSPTSMVTIQGGEIEYVRGKFTVAIDSMKSALTTTSLDISFPLIYSYLALSYHKLNDTDQFLKYSLKMDTVSIEKKSHP